MPEFLKDDKDPRQFDAEAVDAYMKAHAEGWGDGVKAERERILAMAEDGARIYREARMDDAAAALLAFVGVLRQGEGDHA